VYRPVGVALLVALREHVPGFDGEHSPASATLFQVVADAMRAGVTAPGGAV
jgi:hypothetical protein